MPLKHVGVTRARTHHWRFSLLAWSLFIPPSSLRPRFGIGWSTFVAVLDAEC
jgi:hypothetical protein